MFRSLFFIFCSSFFVIHFFVFRCLLFVFCFLFDALKFHGIQLSILKKNYQKRNLPRTLGVPTLKHRRIFAIGPICGMPILFRLNSFAFFVWLAD